MVSVSRRRHRVVAALTGFALVAIFLFFAAPALVTFVLASWVEAQTGRTLAVDKSAIAWGSTTTLE